MQQQMSGQQMLFPAAQRQETAGPINQGLTFNFHDNRFFGGQFTQAPPNYGLMPMSSDQPKYPYGHSYAGLKTLPPGSYEKVKRMNARLQRVSTHFICKYPNCDKIFGKSTSLIVHYWRHIDMRPFRCHICQTSFTQSCTLSRHNRAVHNISSARSLTLADI